MGPPGANVHDCDTPATSRTTATSTAIATTMSRTVSAERGGLDGGGGPPTHRGAGSGSDVTVSSSQRHRPSARVIRLHGHDEGPICEDRR